MTNQLVRLLIVLYFLIYIYLIDEDNEAKYKANKRIYSSDFDGNVHFIFIIFFIIKNIS